MKKATEALLTRRPSRRTFLRGAGGAVLGLPALQLLNAGRAKAAPGDGPKRLLIISLGHSMDVQGSYDDGNLLPSHSGGMITNLSTVLEPLGPHASKISYLHGIDNVMAQAMTSNGHNASGRTVLSPNPHVGASLQADGSLAPSQSGTPLNSVLEDPPSMYASGPSIHYDLGARLGVAPLSLRVGAQSNEHARDFYVSGGSIQRAAGEPDPSRAFRNLFGAPDITPQPTAQERLRAKRGSVLDGVLGNFNRLSSQVGSVDRARLERHADLIRELERGLDQTVQIVCENPSQTPPAGLGNAFEDDNGPQDDLIAAAQMDVITTAFACQATPVAHLHFSNVQTNRFPFLNGGQDLYETADASVNWHAAVHHDDGDGDAAAARRRIAMQWYAKLLGDMIEKLEAMPEGESDSVMDNTLIVWISSLRDSFHGTDNLPIVLAGDLYGALSQGRFHDFSSHGAGGTVGDLWTSIANIMLMDDLSNGYAGAPVSAFGFNTGTNASGRPWHNGPLPGLLAGT